MRDRAATGALTPLEARESPEPYPPLANHRRPPLAPHHLPPWHDEHRVDTAPPALQSRRDY